MVDSKSGLQKSGRQSGQQWSSMKRSKKGRSSNQAGGHATTSSFAANSSSAARQLMLTQAHHSNTKLHLPLLAVLLIGGLLPFFLMTIIAWHVFEDTTKNNIDRVYETSSGSLDNLIVSKIDSVVDSEVEAFRTLYEGAVKIAGAGAFIEHAMASYPYRVRQKRFSFWTQTISEANHYRMTYFIFGCHGHLVGTGYDPETREFIAKYTDVHVFDYYNVSFSSDAGVAYDETGCNTADFFGGTTKESTHTKRFTETTYWLNILNPNYTNHDTTTLEDARLLDWYVENQGNDAECIWTLPYAVDQTPWDPRDYVSTISMTTLDEQGNPNGVLAIDLSLERLSTFIQELSVTFPGTSSVVLTRDQRVMAASDGDNIHVFQLNGVETSELYEFYDYAEKVKRDSTNELYLTMADYLYEHPEFFESLQNTHFDIGDENLRPHPEHIKLYSPSGAQIVISALHMTDHCGMDVTLLIMTDEDIFLEDVYTFLEITMEQIMMDTVISLSIVAVTGIILIIGLIAIARGVSVPLKVMRQDVAKVQELDFDGGFDLLKPWLSELHSIARDYAGLKQCMRRFKCFVPPQIIAELVSDSSEGKGVQRIVENRYISTLFCDVANFTKVAHKCDQNVVLEFANAFLGGSADVIVKYKGTVIDFFGDQIFGIFNAPVEDPEFLENTIKAASKMLDLFDKAKKYFMKKDPMFSLLDVRIGLHCGSALVGKIGSDDRLKYCAIGENVNLGSRLENINKRYGSRMTCSSDFLFSMPRDVKRLYTIRPMEFIRVRRREAPVLIYEVAGLTERLPENIIKEFEEHREMFERVKAKRVTSEELEAFISARGPNAKFLRSQSMLSDSEI